MKVVINRCFGGFGLSTKAVKEYLKRKGLECFVYEDGIKSKYKRIDTDTHSIFVTYSTKDLGKTTVWEELKESVFYPRYLNRSDDDLVWIVENLGEEANGQCANLKVVEIPDGIKYEISEYDGLEEVQERHRSWC